MAGSVDLQRALVELLFARGDGDAIEADVGAFAVDANAVLETGATGTDGGIDGADERITSTAGVFDLEGLRGGTPGLHSEAADLRARAGMDVDGRDREGALVGLGGEVEVVDVGHGALAGDDERVREDCDTIGERPSDRDERLLHLDALGDVEDVAGAKPGAVQGGELIATEEHGVLEEVFLE